MKKLILFIITFGWLVTACNQQPQEATEQLQTEQQRQIEQTEQIEQENFKSIVKSRCFCR